MKVVLVFNESGDTIEFGDVLLPDLAEYYIDYITKNNVNEFRWSREKTKLGKLKKEVLREVFTDINTYLNDVYGVTVFNKFDLGDKYFDQDQLNEIHRTWVKLNQDKDLNIIQTLSGESFDMFKKYQMLNTGTHHAEKGWLAQIQNKLDRAPNFVASPVNIFDQEKVTSFDIAGLTLLYGGLGRQTYDKWECDDEVVDETDTTNFERLYGVARVDLSKPHKVNPPVSYIEFCKRHNVPAVGTHINIANISDYHNKLTQNRNVLYRNTVLNGSSTSSLHIEG